MENVVPTVPSQFLDEPKYPTIAAASISSSILFTILHDDRRILGSFFCFNRVCACRCLGLRLATKSFSPFGDGQPPSIAPSPKHT